MKVKRIFQIVFSIMLIGMFVINGFQETPVEAQTIINDGQNNFTKADDPIQIHLNLVLNPPTLDPSFETDVNALTVIEQLFIGLVDSDDETGDVIPELATSWVFSGGNTVIDFTLRSDIYWSDGNKVTAQDVEYGILRAMAPTTGYPYSYVYASILNATDFHDGNITDPNLVGVDALSETQLRITLSYPATEILSVLSMSFMRPLPSWAISTWGDQWSEPSHIVTNGAYLLTEWVADDHLLLVKNPTYYNATNVQIEEINMVIADPDTAWTMYVNDELDSVEVPPSAPEETIHQREIIREPAGCTYYYGFNTALPPFDNALVRKAFIAATNRGDVTAYTQSGFPAATFTPQGVVGYVDGYYEDVGIPYDPDQARAWLAAAGYPNGLGLPPITLWFNSSSGHQDIANIIHNSWLNDLGVDVNLQEAAWDDYLTQLRNGDYQVWRLGWCMDYPDAHDFLYEGLSQESTAFGAWDNAIYWNYLGQASNTIDQNLRNTFFKQAEESLVETDAVMLPLYHYGVDVATKPYLQRTFGSVQPDIENWRLIEVPQPVLLSLNIELNPDTLDPSLATNSNSLSIIEQLFIGLVDLDDTTGEVKPELATSWAFSNGNTVVDFTLRDDVYWSDGYKVTAKDVEYAILRSLSPVTVSNYAYILSPILNARLYHEGFISDPGMVGVEAISDTLLRITLVEPASEILSILSSPVARPMPKWTIDAWGDQWTLPGRIVTNGAYQLSEWVADDHILLEKNPAYYNEANVQIDTINLVMVDRTTALTLYENGNLDTISMPYDYSGTDPILQQEISKQSTACTYYYGINTSLPPFDNVLVRKAFIAATNRNDLIGNLIPSGFPALTFSPKGVFGYVDGMLEGVGIPYNPTQARAWLAEAGYPNGVGLPPITLWFNTSVGHQAIAQVVHDSWLNVLGVDVNIQDVVWTDYLSDLHNGDYQIWRLGWCMDYPDAKNFLYDSVSAYASDAYGGWNNTTYWGYLNQASNTFDQNARKSLFKQAEEILVETDAVMLPLYHYGYDVATKPYLQRTFGSVQPDYENWRITTTTQSIPAASGGTVTSYDGQVQIQIDAGDFLDDVIITLTPATGMSPQSILAGNGLVFELTAEYSDGSPAEIAPGQTVVIQVSYSDGDIRTIEEETLALYYWDGVTWVKETSSLVDSVNNTITATLDHFSLWAVFGETNRVYVPMLSR